jgi:high-affinity nickel-transport protein
MNFAYDWAFARPVRKVYYNLTITGLSVFVAMFIGVVEVLGLLGQDGHLTGPGWAWLDRFDLNQAGFVIAGVFVLTWVVALAIWRFGKIEQRWDRAAGKSGSGEDPSPGEDPGLGGPESERVLARVPGSC